MLVPMSDQPNDLEQRKLLYGLSGGNTDPQAAQQPAPPMQPMLPGSTEPNIKIVTGGEQSQYGDAWNALVASGASQKHPAQMRQLQALIAAGSWSQAAKQVAAIKKLLAAPAKVATGVPPPVAAATPKTKSLLVIGGLLALGAAAMWFVTKKGKGE